MSVKGPPASPLFASVSAIMYLMSSPNEFATLRAMEQPDVPIPISSMLEVDSLI